MYRYWPYGLEEFEYIQSYFAGPIVWVDEKQVNI